MWAPHASEEKASEGEGREKRSLRKRKSSFSHVNVNFQSSSLSSSLCWRHMKTRSSDSSSSQNVDLQVLKMSHQLSLGTIRTWLKGQTFTFLRRGWRSILSFSGCIWLVLLFSQHSHWDPLNVTELGLWLTDDFWDSACPVDSSWSPQHALAPDPLLLLTIVFPPCQHDSTLYFLWVAALGRPYFITY